MTGKNIDTERTCPRCGRTVTEVNLNPQDVGTFTFCDLNETGESE